MPSPPTPALAGLAAIALALAGCDPAADDTAPADPAPADPAQADVPQTETAPTAGSVRQAGPVSAFSASMQGRWGMTPADCDPEEAANKGLLTVDAESLTFYESVAEPDRVIAAADGTLAGTFAYEGEGMTWSREASLKLVDGGAVLILEEMGDDAPPGARRYERCA